MKKIFIEQDRSRYSTNYTILITFSIPTILHPLLLLEYEWTGSTWEGKRIEMELKLVPVNALKVLQREPCLRIILHHVTALVDLSTL